MNIDALWYTLGAVVTVALLQGWATRAIHRRQLAQTQARHLKTQQATDKMLQQSRLQNAQLSQELAAARLTMKRPPRTEPPARARPDEDARNALMKVLDTSPPPKRTLPVDGFAETMPSMQFRTSAMGSLQ